MDKSQSELKMEIDRESEKDVDCGWLSMSGSVI